MDSKNILGHYDYRSGVGGAVIQLPLGAALSSVSAYALAPGATVQIGLFANLIPVPVNGAIAADVAGGMVTDVIALPVTVTFVGTAGYFADWYL